jgi:di/tricarboxylate transporter
LDPILFFYFVLAGCLALFISGLIRHDLIALLALLMLVLGGLVPQQDAFLGFANPAVITVAAVLVISKCLEAAGITSLANRAVVWVGPRPTLQVLFFSGTVLILSSFMNNVGALALMMPVAIETARREKRSPSFLLMPMAFASLLGGMTTLIGTPPNLLISNYRLSHHGQPFSMFSFSPVGLPVALAGTAFIVLIGWRLIPRRTSGTGDELFDIENYFAEVHVTEESKSVGELVRDVLKGVEDVTMVGFHRDDEKYSINNRFLRLSAGDVLILRANPRSLKKFIDDNRFRLGGIKPGREDLNDGEMELIEAVVLQGSTTEQSSPRRLDLRNRFGINMIAIARRGLAISTQLKDIRFKAGDVLLLQMPTTSMRESLARLGLLPLAKRELHVTRPRRLTLTIAIFGIAIVLTSLGYLSAAVSFSTAAIVMILLRIISIREAYESIDWSIIVLLGAMIPVGSAFESSGAVAQLTQSIGQFQVMQNPVWLLTFVLVLTMFLSDILNNAATAIVMAPVASAIAASLSVSADPFLLAVAIGASCAFLTPIGHQSNTLVMGPGGYHFGDYFRMGLVLEVLVVVISIPVLSWYFGFQV